MRTRKERQRENKWPLEEEKRRGRRKDSQMKREKMKAAEVKRTNTRVSTETRR